MHPDVRSILTNHSTCEECHESLAQGIAKALGFGPSLHRHIKIRGKFVGFVYIDVFTAGIDDLTELLVEFEELFRTGLHDLSVIDIDIDGMWSGHRLQENLPNPD